MERQLCTLVSVLQQGHHNNICIVLWMFWLTLGRSLHFFLVLLLLTLNIICLLWVLPFDISLRKTKKGLYWWEELQSISFQQCQRLRCFSEIFVYKLLWQPHFQFVLFYIWKTCSKSLMKSNSCIFYILLYLIANFKQVFTMF